MKLHSFSLVLAAMHGSAPPDPSLTFEHDFAEDKNLMGRRGPAVTFTRASPAHYWDSTGTLRQTNFNAVDYDGVADYLDGTDLLGAAAGGTDIVDGKKAVFSVWLRLDGSEMRFLSSSNSRINIIRKANNKFKLTAKNTSNNIILDIGTAATFTSSASWIHVLASWDLGIPGARHLYIDDVSDLAIDISGALPIGLSQLDIGQRASGENVLNGCVVGINVWGTRRPDAFLQQ